MVVEVVVVLVLVVLVLVELVLLVEVDVDELEVVVLVVVLAEHGAVVVVVDGTVEVVLVVDVLVVVTAANPVGAVVQHDPMVGNGAVAAVVRTGDPALVVVVAAARLAADTVAERTTVPMRTFTNRTDQRGIR